MNIGAEATKSWKSFTRTATWRDVKWLTSFTSLPVIAKGILTGILNLPLLFRYTLLSFAQLILS